MDYVEVEGSSIDDAIDQALQRLGVDRDKVEIEIVSNATRGLFGLGGRKAKVRATLRSPLLIDTPTPEREQSGQPTRAEPSEASPARTTADAAVDSDRADQAQRILEVVVRLMGTPATVEMSEDPDGRRLAIAGDTSGVLIGRRGQTLDALEYLINRIASREEDHLPRLVVDSQNYRARRRQALEDLARRLAERTRRRGKTVTLNPMSPRDRRTIHVTLRGESSLATQSFGKGYFRRVLIIPEGDRRRSRSQRGDE